MQRIDATVEGLLAGKERIQFLAQGVVLAAPARGHHGTARLRQRPRAENAAHAFDAVRKLFDLRQVAACDSGQHLSGVGIDRSPELAQKCRRRPAAAPEHVGKAGWVQGRALAVALALRIGQMGVHERKSRKPDSVCLWGRIC